MLMNALLIYHFITNYPQNLMAKNNFYLAVSVDKNPECGFTGGFGSRSLMRFHS